MQNDCAEVIQIAHFIIVHNLSITYCEDNCCRAPISDYYWNYLMWCVLARMHVECLCESDKSGDLVFFKSNIVCVVCKTTIKVINDNATINTTKNKIKIQYLMWVYEYNVNRKWCSELTVLEKCILKNIQSLLIRKALLKSI